MEKLDAWVNTAMDASTTTEEFCGKHQRYSVKYGKGNM